MQRALVWLNLYGGEAFRHKLKNRQKMHFLCFLAVFALTSDSLGWATSMPFASINSTNPRTNPWNFHKKNGELAELENDLFFRRPFWIFFSKKIKNCIISMKTSSPFIWGIINFCTMDGFFGILEKTSSELICTGLYLPGWLGCRSPVTIRNRHSRPPRAVTPDQWSMVGGLRRVSVSVLSCRSFLRSFGDKMCPHR